MELNVIKKLEFQNKLWEKMEKKGIKTKVEK